MIEVDVTATGAAPRAGGFAYARQSGQQVRLALAPQWAGLRVVLQFSDGANLVNAPLNGDTAEIPAAAISTPWKTLRLGITGYHHIVPHARALGPFWCELGAIRPEGMMGQGEGGTAPDLSSYLTKADAQNTYATQAALDAKPETTVTRASESGSWGSQSTYTIAQTGAGSLQLVKRVDREGAGTRTSMTLDGVALATAADIPDVSRFITSDALQPLATQAWVQSYIASLDGTNVAA